MSDSPVGEPSGAVGEALVDRAHVSPFGAGPTDALGRRVCGAAGVDERDAPA
jgi:hypothetical protein